jgi:hypothetical protein
VAPRSLKPTVPESYIWNQLFHRRPVGLIDHVGLSKCPLPLPRLFGQNVICIGLRIGYLPCPRSLEALGRSSVCLHLWHGGTSPVLPEILPPQSPQTAVELRCPWQRRLSGLHKDSYYLKTNVNKTPPRLGRRFLKSAEGFAGSYFGARTIKMWRPSLLIACSILQMSDVSSATRLRMVVPSSV